MNQTLQLTDYIPQYVSLYYVDYRDDFDEHEDIQEECSNNMEKLYEKAYEWYEEQESSNMHDYLEETRKNMERHTNGMRNRKAQTCTTIWRRQERTWKRTI